jgi:hypothetical protein
MIIAPQCCCDPIGCGAVQLWSQALTHGIPVPAPPSDVAAWTKAEGDNDPPSPNRVAWENILAAIENVVLSVPGALTGIVPGYYWPGTPFGSGVLGTTVNQITVEYETDHIFKPSGYSSYVRVTATIANDTGFVQSVSFTSDSGTYTWALEQSESGMAVIETGDDGIITEVSLLMSWVHSRVYEEPSVDDYSAASIDTNHLGGEVYRDHEVGGTSSIVFSLGGLDENAGEADARALSLLQDGDGFNMMSRRFDNGVYNAAGEFLGVDLDWNKCYEIKESLAFGLQLQGTTEMNDSVPVGSEDEHFGIFPRRKVAVESDGWTMNVQGGENASLTSKYHHFQALRYGKTYYGRVLANADMNDFTVIHARCLVEIQDGMENRLHEREQNPPEDGPGFFVGSPTVNDPCSATYRLSKGRYSFTAADLVADWGMAVLHRRTYFNTYEDFPDHGGGSAACYTFPDLTIVDEEETNYANGPGWRKDQCHNYGGG